MFSEIQSAIALFAVRSILVLTIGLCQHGKHGTKTSRTGNRYGVISDESYCMYSKWRKLFVLIGYHHTRHYPLLSNWLVGSRAHFFAVAWRHRVLHSSPGTGNWYRTLYGTVCRAVGYWCVALSV